MFACILDLQQCLLIGVYNMLNERPIKIKTGKLVLCFSEMSELPEQWNLYLIPLSTTAVLCRNNPENSQKLHI